jgi:VanZ family protein
MFVPGRTSDGYDVLADAIGATIAVVGGWLVRAVRR